MQFFLDSGFFLLPVRQDPQAAKLHSSQDVLTIAQPAAVHSSALAKCIKPTQSWWLKPTP